MTDAPHPRRTLLVVDDEADITVALTDLFEDRFRVRATTSPREALRWLAEDHSIAVILSDQRMPDMPGNIFLAEARKISDAESILLTGYADLSAVASAVNLGAISGYVPKPWESEALVAMVEAAAERVALRDALAFERGVYRALVDGSADAVSVIDTSLATLRGNAAYTLMVSARPDDESADRAALANGYSDSEREWTDNAGDSRWTRTQRIPFEGKQGKRYLLRIESDETERRLAERKLHQGEKLQSLGTLAGGIAHDFNNLLAIVVGNLDLAKRSLADPARLSKLLERAYDAAQRGTAVSRRLLSFSRHGNGDAKRFNPRDTIIDLSDLLSQAMQNRARIALDIDPETWPVKADPGQFELALLNLCINARDAMPGGGTVTIRTRNMRANPARLDFSDDHVWIAVVDQGDGISPEIQARIFEPFFTTKPHGVGTGLGLPIVRAMAQAAGGDVRIESELGDGATVAMWLPRCAADPTPLHVETEITVLRSLRVLVVEDDPELCTTIASQLGEMGHQTMSCASAEEAIKVASAAKFDLIVTDFALPGMNGRQLIELMATCQPATRSLLITGYAAGPQLVDQTVLMKPFTSQQLMSALAKLFADAPAR